MRVSLALVLVCLPLASACSKGAPVQPRDDDAAAVTERAPPAPPTVDDIITAADPFTRPIPAGETFPLKQGESRTTTGGLEVTYASHGHKQPAGPGRFLQMVRLELGRGEQQQQVELRGTDDVLEAEIDALGALLVVRGGYAGIDVTVAARKTPAPLDEEAAWALIDELAARRGLVKDGGGGSVDEGVLHYGAVHEGKGVWHARLGMYTRRAWFLRASFD